MYKGTEALESFIDKTVGFCSKGGFFSFFILLLTVLSSGVYKATELMA